MEQEQQEQDSALMLRPWQAGLSVDASSLASRTQKSMSPPPGIPPPAPADAFSGLSATTASVVRNSAAMDAAFCSADRVTLAGSMIPALIRSLYSPVAASRPSPAGRPLTFSATTPPSRPALIAI